MFSDRPAGFIGRRRWIGKAADGERLSKRLADICLRIKKAQFITGLFLFFGEPLRLNDAPQLSRRYVSCTWPFFALANFKFYLLILIKTGIAFHLDFRMMNKKIISTIVWLNESKTLACIKPFHCTCTHNNYSLACFYAALITSLYHIFTKHILERRKNTLH